MCFSKETFKNEFPDWPIPEILKVNPIPHVFKLIDYLEEVNKLTDVPEYQYNQIYNLDYVLDLMSGTQGKSIYLEPFPADTIENIKKMKEPEWDDNPFRNEVNNVLDDKKIELNLKKPSLSATSIQTYNQCPLKYKYKYIDAIPSAPEKLYFQLGKVIHKVLELFHKLEYNSLEDLLRLLDENWQEGGYKYKLQEEQNRLDANNMLNNYWQYFQNNPVNKIITEHWFSFETEHAYLSGKCDRIDINKNDKISIIDYKTSKISKTENEIKKDIQLGIYALFSSVHGVEMNDGKIIHNIPEKISMLFLRENNPEVTVQFNSDDIEKFNKQIKLTAESIKRCEFEGSKGKHCEWCDFRELICPLFG